MAEVGNEIARKVEGGGGGGGRGRDEGGGRSEGGVEVGDGGGPRLG